MEIKLFVNRSIAVDFAQKAQIIKAKRHWHWWFEYHDDKRAKDEGGLQVQGGLALTPWNRWHCCQRAFIAGSLDEQ